jgi:hypothetical protein
VFLVNSRHPLVCAPSHCLRNGRAPFFQGYGGNLPSSFNTVLSSASVCSTSPPVSVWGTVLAPGLFPGTPSPHPQSDKGIRLTAFVTSGRPRNINLVPIGYGFRPRLRGRLTLRGLTLRRNPWTYGDRVSRSVCRYSCQQSRFRYLQHPSRDTFAGLRNAPLPRDPKAPPPPPPRAPPAASVHGLSPVTFSAQDGLFRPVSYYAFFKGWLLLSQPPGCFGLPTSFPT